MGGEADVRLAADHSHRANRSADWQATDSQVGHAGESFTRSILQGVDYRETIAWRGDAKFAIPYPAFGGIPVDDTVEASIGLRRDRQWKIKPLAPIPGLKRDAPTLSFGRGYQEPPITDHLPMRDRRRVLGKSGVGYGQPSNEGRQDRRQLRHIGAPKHFSVASIVRVGLTRERLENFEARRIEVQCLLKAGPVFCAPADTGLWTCRSDRTNVASPASRKFLRRCSAGSNLAKSA